MNCLLACDPAGRVIWMLNGWEGSANDAKIYRDAISSRNLRIQPRRYFVADAGFGAAYRLLVPFKGIRYHLAEFAKASQLRIQVEKTIGVLKQKFRIHRVEPTYCPKVQCLIIYASAGIMNFLIDNGDSDDLAIKDYEPDDFDELMSVRQPEVPTNDWYSSDDRKVGKNAKMNRFRARISKQMWDDYQTVLEKRRE